MKVFLWLQRHKLQIWRAIKACPIGRSSDCLMTAHWEFYTEFSFFSMLIIIYNLLYGKNLLTLQMKFIGCENHFRRKSFSPFDGGTTTTKAGIICTVKLQLPDRPQMVCFFLFWLKYIAFVRPTRYRCITLMFIVYSNIVIIQVLPSIKCPFFIAIPLQ